MFPMNAASTLLPAVDPELRRCWLNGGLTEQQVGQLAERGLCSWSKVENEIKENALDFIINVANIAGVPLEAVKTATQNVLDTVYMLSMRPKVFLSSARKDAVLPPLGSPSNSSQSVRHLEPKGLNVWINVGRKERISALLRRLAYGVTRGSSTAAGGSNVTGGSTAAGGGGGGSSTPGGCRSAEGSGRSGSAKGGGGGGGGSTFEAEVLTLIEDADDIFRSTSGGLIRVQEPHQRRPVPLNNEIAAFTLTLGLLEALAVLLNGVLERLVASSEGIAAAAGAAPASAVAGAQPAAAGTAAAGAAAGAQPATGTAAVAAAVLGAAAAGAEPAAGTAAATGPAAASAAGLVCRVTWLPGQKLKDLSEMPSQQQAQQSASDALRPDASCRVEVVDMATKQRWTRCGCFVEVKAPVPLVTEDGEPLPLVDLWNAGNTLIKAIFAQVNTYMHYLDVSYALLSSYHATWPVHRTGPPGAQRSQAQLPVCAAAAAAAARLHVSGGVTTRSNAAAARASGGAAGSSGGCSGSSGGPVAGAGGGGGGSGRSSYRSFGVQDGVLHVAGPFLAATEYTEERPAATVTGATLYTVMLGLVDVLDRLASPVGGSTLARRRSPALPPGPGPPGPNAGPSMSGGGDGRDAGQQGGGGAAAAGGARHAGGQEVAGGAGAAASGSRAARPPASAAWQSAAGEQAQPASLLQQQLRGQLQGAFGVALEPAGEQAQPASLLQQQQPTPLPPRIMAVPETDYPEELQQGYAGVSCPGLVDGEASVLKFLNPDERGIAAFEAERRAYAALAALQGDVLPRLLIASRLADVGPPPPWPRPGDDEEPGEPERQGWPNGEVRLIATSRVRGVTLREAVVRGGGRITPAVAAAAVRALQRLHAADVVLPGGGHDRADDGGGGGGRGRFLHGDIRLSNFMLLLPEVMAEAEAEEAPGAEVAEEPRCVVIDLGLSRLDGTEEEQRGEVRQLELRLRGITSGHGQQ